MYAGTKTFQNICSLISETCIPGYITVFPASFSLTKQFNSVLQTLLRQYEKLQDSFQLIEEFRGISIEGQQFKYFAVHLNQEN